MTIQEILKEFKVDFLETGHHHCREGWIQVRHCPGCGSQNFHLGFNIRAGFWNCWKCGAKYGPKVMSQLGIPYSAIKEIHIGVFKEQETKHKLVEPKHLLPLDECSQHRLYLIHRCLNPNTIENYWQVQGIKIAPQLSWRLYIPVFHRGEKVSWTTRAIGEVKQRYISAPKNCEAMNIKKVVYGADMCGHTIVVCEGPIDAWAIGPGAGATFGTAFTPAQVNRISEYPYRYICFDSSRDAQAKARELAKLLSVFPGITQNIVLDAKDPAEASPQELKALRKATKLK